MKMIMTMLMILRSTVIEVIKTVSIFFMKDNLNVKNTNKSIEVTFNQIFLKKKHLNNIQANISGQKSI